MSESLVKKLLGYDVYTVDSTDNSGTTIVKRAFQCSICSHKYMYTNNVNIQTVNTVMLLSYLSPVVLY